MFLGEESRELLLSFCLAAIRFSRSSKCLDDSLDDEASVPRLGRPLLALSSLIFARNLSSNDARELLLCLLLLRLSLRLSSFSLFFMRSLKDKPGDGDRDLLISSPLLLAAIRASKLSSCRDDGEDEMPRCDGLGDLPLRLPSLIFLWSRCSNEDPDPELDLLFNSLSLFDNLFCNFSSNEDDLDAGLLPRCAPSLPFNFLCIL